MFRAAAARALKPGSGAASGWQLPGGGACLGHVTAGLRTTFARVGRAIGTLLVAVALLAAPAVSVATEAGEPWRPGLEHARAFAATRAGTISFAVRTERRLYRSDAYRGFRSASVVKAMLMVAYLNHESVRTRPLTKADRALLEPMVRWSNNAAASQVRNFVGNGALLHLARRCARSHAAASGKASTGCRNHPQEPRFSLSRSSAGKLDERLPPQIMAIVVT